MHSYNLETTFRKVINGIFISIFWLCLIGLSHYVGMNVLFFDKEGGSCISILIAVYSVIAIIYTSFLLYNKTIWIKKSFFGILLLIVYVSVRIVFDYQNTNELRTFWFSTTSGCLIFYSLGFFINYLFKYISIISDNKFMESKVNHCFVTVYIVYNFLLFIVILLFLSTRSHATYFLVDNFGQYQRAGKLLTINTVLVSYCFIWGNGKLNNIKNSICYILYAVFSSLVAQILGSNSAFVIILCLCFISLVIVRKKAHTIFPQKINHSVVKMIITLCKTFLINFILISFLLLFLQDVLPPMRIFGYGKENKDYNPLKSRIELLRNNFVTQFEVCPIWGSMNADTYTTGKGTYVHSFVLSLLTHTGIIGLGIFICYLYLAIKEYLYDWLNYIFDKKQFMVKTFILFVFIFLLIIASISVFFNWNPLWFMFGFCFSPMGNKSVIMNRGRNSESCNLNCIK